MVAGAELLSRMQEPRAKMSGSQDRHAEMSEAQPFDGRIGGDHLEPQQEASSLDDRQFAGNGTISAMVYLLHCV